MPGIPHIAMGKRISGILLFVLWLVSWGVYVLARPPQVVLWFAPLASIAHLASCKEFWHRESIGSEATATANKQRLNNDSRGSTMEKKVFIVHGHDDVAKLELKNYLQNTLGLPQPIILHEQPSLGRTIMEKFEDYAADANLVFVLLTPDDALANAKSSNDEKRRSRQNVIFEMGYFMAKLGRRSGRVVLLYKGALDLPSDISGIIYVDISHGIDSAGEKIRREVQDF
jgi:predicted nucleotide-binding protein